MVNFKMFIYEAYVYVWGSVIPYVRGTAWVVAGKYMGGKLILNGPNCYPPPTPFCENHNHCITQQDMHERRGDALNHLFWDNHTYVPSQKRCIGFVN